MFRISFSLGWEERERERARFTCIATLPKALPDLKSYKTTVLSLPLDANTLVSDLLNATETICSPIEDVEVEWNFRVEIGEVLVSSKISIE